MNRVSFRNWLLIGVVALVGLDSCTQAGEALLDRKKRENDAEIAQYIASNNLTDQARTTDNGTYYVVTTTNPTGQTAGVGDEIQYRYVARRLDGLVVDSSQVAAGQAQAFTRGYFLQSLISAGLYDGIVNSGAVVNPTTRMGLRKGEKAMFLVPSYLDQGRVGTLLLPQYSPVRYDVTVVNVRTEDQQIQDYLTANKLTPTSTDADGLRFIRTKANPDSVQATTGKTVVVNYKGTLLNGTQFDARQDSSFSFQLGAEKVVKGFDNGVLKLRAGEKATIIFPSTLGYGITGSPASSGRTGIPPYSPLRFDIELVSVK